MKSYENINIKVFGSKKAYAASDRQDESKIAASIREKVLPKTDIDYSSVSVKVKRKADQTPDYLIAYMLRKDTYTADVVKIEIDSDYEVSDVIQNYDDSGEEEEEEEEIGYEASEYACDFVAATPCSTIPTAVAAVNTLHSLAVSVGLKSVKLIGPQATVANYKAYLKSGLKGFVNVGHGYTGGIVLDNGSLTASWFSSLSNDPLKPAVVYFNSCQVFNPPLQPAVMAAGARTFIGGKVNLRIGTSEEVCKCFWDRSLKLLSCMGTNLAQCERQKYHAQGHHGIGGDMGVFWLAKWFNNQTVIRAHTKHYSKAAWALFPGSCWIPIRPASPDGVTNIFAIICEALANNHRVDVYIRNSQIDQATLR
jgi:hypothetical protein